MDASAEEVFKQYDIKINNSYRTRGAFILETNKGTKLFKAFGGSSRKAEYENQVLEALKGTGYQNVDSYVKNSEGQIISKDGRGNSYVIKDWFIGQECSLKERQDIYRAVHTLAALHKKMRGIMIQDSSGIQELPGLLTIYEKHNRELKRVRSYIRDKKQKNEFELCFLSCYERFYEEGQQALSQLRESGYEEEWRSAIEQGVFCHGNFTYHNIIFLSQDTAITNFDRAAPNVQITDLYHFLRKAMEKNNWNTDLGSSIIAEYNKVEKVNEAQKRILYIMLLYPEKFWKITNCYYNGRKSWVPQKNIRKLKDIEEQSREKENFLKYLKTL